MTRPHTVIGRIVLAQFPTRCTAGEWLTTTRAHNYLLIWEIRVDDPLLLLKFRNGSLKDSQLAVNLADGDFPSIGLIERLDRHKPVEFAF
ncbi:MAG: hypothetical protein NTX11_02405 [Candidatus Saccharibacteria bacterium]|nr:hypothetical protein [Candidatus Saccharibacteria bacterium]